MKINERIDVDEAGGEKKSGPVLDAMKEFNGYTYRIAFEHLAMQNAYLEYEIEQLRQAATKGRQTKMPTKQRIK